MTRRLGRSASRSSSRLFTPLARAGQCPRAYHSRFELRAEAEPTQDAGEVIGPLAVAQCQCECDGLGIAPAGQILRVAQKRVDIVLDVELFNQGGHQIGGP